MTDQNDHTESAEAPTLDAAQVAALIEEHCLTKKDAESILGRGLTVDEWKLRKPKDYLIAFRAQQWRAQHSWLPVTLARRAAGADEDKATALVEGLARQMSRLSATTLSAWLSGQVTAEMCIAKHPSWEVIRRRLERVREEHPELDDLTALRVARADATLDWPRDTSQDALRDKAVQLRKRWPVLDKTMAMRAARFDMTLDDVAALGPIDCAILPRAMELLQSHPELHRKAARALALQGADEEETAAIIEAGRVSDELWSKLSDKGPVALLTQSGVVTYDLVPPGKHPYVLFSRDGSSTGKLDVLVGFSEADRGTVLGRMKRAPEVAEPTHTRDPDRPVVEREPIHQAIAESRRVRFILVDGKAFTALPHRGTRFEYLAEVKGGAPVIVLHHALWAAIPEPPPKSGGGAPKKADKGAKKKKRGGRRR